MPGLTVHDSTAVGSNGATVRPRFQQLNWGPPVPKEFERSASRAPKSKARRGWHRASSADRAVPNGLLVAPA